MKNSALLVLALAALPIVSDAQGPFYVTCGQPVRYANPTITLNFDPGDLNGTTFPKSTADTIVVKAMDIWNSLSAPGVVLSTFKFVKGTDLASDITVSNYKNLVYPKSAGTSDHPSLNDGLNPVIYDFDGSIVDDFLGSNQHLSTVGFATSVAYDDRSNFRPGSAYAIINGNTDPIYNVTTAVMTNVIAHELGHMMGLDHSQANTTAICSFPSDNYPLMYPVANCRASANLHEDDMASVITLYPGGNSTVIYGEISGYFKYTNGVPIKGANIYAELGPASVNSFSNISDYLNENTGYFKMYVPAGTYTLHSVNIDPTFTGTRRIGPYSSPNQSVPKATFSTSITVSSGYATHVTFYDDGSGSVLNNQAMDFTSEATCPSASSGGGGGGGSLSWLVLLGLCGVWYVRLKSRRHARRVETTPTR